MKVFVFMKGCFSNEV